MPNPIFTIGHSNQPPEALLALLATHRIQAIADVRSTPYSRYNPQFDREALRDSLKAAGLQYAFLGRELGARSDDPACYLYGRVQFPALAATPLFQQGLTRILEGSQKLRIALLCAEKDPLDCHRSILVTRHLHARHPDIQHILPDSSLESQPALLDRLMAAFRINSTAHLFRSASELEDEAYDLQAQRIAYNASAPASTAA